MSTNATHESTTTEQTRIEADPNVPTIRIIRDFDAPPDKVFRAWIDPELVVKWLGPKSTEMRIDEWTLVPAATIATQRCRTAPRSPRLRVLPQVRPDERLCRPLPGKECPMVSAWTPWCSRTSEMAVRGPSGCPSGQFRGSRRDHRKRDGGRGLRGLRKAGRHAR